MAQKIVSGFLVYCGCRVAAMQGFLAAEQQLAVVVCLRPNAIESRLNLADVIRQAAEYAPN